MLFTPQDKPIYLLDDPLSAVDAHVAQHLYKHCIMGILQAKTRILCTHQVHFLTRADVVVVMEGGKIIQSGAPSEVLCEEMVTLLGRHRGLDDASSSRDREEKLREIRDKRQEEVEGSREEERERGVVRAGVYTSYWRAVGVCLSPAVLLAVLLMQASRNTSDWWLAYWISHTHAAAGNSSTPTPGANLSVVDSLADNSSGSSDNLQFYLSVYGGLAGANSVFTFMRAFLFAFGGVQAAAVVHRRLLSAVLKVTF